MPTTGQPGGRPRTPRRKAEATTPFHIRVLRKPKRRRMGGAASFMRNDPARRAEGDQAAPAGGHAEADLHHHRQQERQGAAGDAGQGPADHRQAEGRASASGGSPGSGAGFLRAWQEIAQPGARPTPIMAAVRMARPAAAARHLQAEHEAGQGDAGQQEARAGRSGPGPAP